MILNGKTIDLKEDISVEQLLKDYDLNPQKVVVEVNMEILDDEVYSTYLLKNRLLCLLPHYFLLNQFFFQYYQ